MGTVVDSLFTVLMSWVRALVNGLWALFSRENTMLAFLGKNWLLIAAALIAAGLVIDWLVWLVRWQPYHIWAQRVRRLLRLPQEDDGEESDEPLGKARPAVLPKRETRRKTEWDDEAAYAAYEAAGAPAVDEEEEREAIARADDVPDEELGAYPGMRYGSVPDAGAMHETQRYSALTSEGPGAAEVSRRREEIDAYRRMQQEAAQRAREERMRQEEAARQEAERARAQEEERIRQQRAQEKSEEEKRAEQARLAQEAYERELAEYEIKRAQYERELAEYERQMAEYEAQQAAAEAAKGARRRRRDAAYSEYIEGEAVDELPDAPAWPDPQTVKIKPVAAKAARKESKKKSGLMGQMARIIEGEEEEELASLHALPPRVDRNDAYRPAKEAKPARKTARRSGRNA